jgi:hypothetical protein
VRAATSPSLPAEQKAALAIMEKTFRCYIMEDATARSIKEELTALEGALEGARNVMKLGYQAPDGLGFVEASSVLLRTRMRTERDEATRKACFHGAASVGPAVAPGLAKIAAKRNQMARALGFVDYYGAFPLWISRHACADQRYFHSAIHQTTRCRLLRGSTRSGCLRSWTASRRARGR